MFLLLLTLFHIAVSAYITLYVSGNMNTYGTRTEVCVTAN